MNRSVHKAGNPKRGLFVAPFDELADPLALVDLAVRAEARGWDGFFLWDHIRYRPPVSAVADPWVMLSAIAARTHRLRLGPLVTPLSRRRVEKVARETVTLDRLSEGRLTFGVGLGGTEELGRLGEVVEPRERARLLDEALGRLNELWGGEFEPRPVQRPRIPIWVGGVWPHRRPLRRAARWDGFFPIDVPGPPALAEMVDEIRGARDGSLDGFDVVVEMPPGQDPAPWAQAGATWVLTEFGKQPRAAQVEEAIDAGPGGRLPCR